MKKGQKYPPEVLSDNEVERLIATLSSKSSTGIRDRALIAVLWRSQLRLGETLALKPADYDALVGTLRVLHGKGDKHRVVAIDAFGQALLDRWLERRHKLGHNGHKLIFCTVQGHSVEQSFVRKRLRETARKAGITKRVHAHGLRHSGASRLVERGVSMLDIRDQLGHSSLVTTERYLQQIHPAQRIERIQRAT